MDKVVASLDEAVADIGDGSVVGFAGFGLLHGYPVSLLHALRRRGSRELTLVCNSLGAGRDVRMELIEEGQVSKLIAAFSSRPGQRSVAEDLIDAGKLDVELVPQGILVERCRAAAAGVPAFFTAVGADTVLAEGKETRSFGDRPHVLETALPLDYALLRGWKADTAGNVVFRGAAQNLNPSFAKAAECAIVEVEDIVEPGELAPGDIDLPGIWVSRVVRATERVSVAELAAGAAARRRAPDSARVYFDKTALTREGIARRAARLLHEGAYANLGTGMPTMVSNHLHGRDVTLHAENGFLGYGGLVSGDDIDPDVYNAASQFVAVNSGASFFDSVESFEMARSGKLDAVVLGAYQVDQDANLANWTTPAQSGGGIGGAMDLVSGAKQLIIVMEHQDSRGRPKLVRHCDYPLTGAHCVDVVVTDLALLVRRDGEFWLDEVAPGFTPEEVLSLTDMDVRVSPDVVEMEPAE
ncbi:3-oxoacid CoA-transferase [Nocardia miyunensis]|uniref:3-oxoacid CoA-transferase n=1 Tax=Nocardia miyunensis TaxID=282684 RepID=UPI000A0188A4|nr:3-oxoacid CoA-transferase [Nocardia miyunensis]